MSWITRRMLKFQSLAAVVTALFVTGTPIMATAHTAAEVEDFNVAQAYTQDIKGWNGTRWGMSLDEVKALFPGVQPDVPAANGNPRYVLKGFKRMNFTYQVAFAFKDNQLKSVNLTQTEGNLEVGYSVLLQDLQEKYGQPAPVRSALGATKWILPSTEITLLKVADFLTLSYIPKQARQDI